MKKASVLLLLLLLFGGTHGYTEEIGSYKIPGPVKYAGTMIESGTYTIHIVDGAEGPYLQLSRGSQVVAEDLAIVIPAKGSGKNSIQLVKIAGHEFVRIRVRHGDNWYYAYLEK